MALTHEEEDAVSTTSSSSMKRSPLAPIAVDGHRTSDDPKLALSSSSPSVSGSYSDDELSPRPSLYQRRKTSVPGLSIIRPTYHRRRSHNRWPSPARNPSSLTPINPNFITTRRTSLPALHFPETVKNVAPRQLDTYTSQRDSISEDMYGALQSFTFGAPPRQTTHQTPDDCEDEDERQRGDRAKMRAIDDGNRRPSLPTNSSIPTPRSQPSVSSLSSAGIEVGERQWDEHSEPNWDIVMGDITPTRATPPNSSSGNFSTHSEPRRPSVSIAIPMLRRRSRSADELAVDFEQRMRGSAPTQVTLSTSTPLFSWVERRQSPDGAKENSSSPEENAYDGYDLNFILSQNPANMDTHGLHLKHQSSSGLLRGKFKSKVKNAAQSRFEDTFMRHIMESDPLHRQRQAEWTFRRELRPNHSSHISKSKDKDRTSRLSEDSEGWRCEWVGRFNVFKIRSGDTRGPQSTSDASKGLYNRLQIMHSPDPENKGNKLGGPRVLVHRHSRARAFSIFRAYNIHPKKAMIPTDSVLLAVKAVLREYTRTESTRALRTHGLMDDNSSQSHLSRHRSGGSEKDTSRSQANNVTNSRRDHGTLPTTNSQHSQQSSTATSRSASQSPEVRSRKISLRNTPPPNPSRHTTTVSTSRPPFSPPTETHAQPFPSIASNVEYVPPVPQWVPPSPRSPRLSTSHAEAYAMIDPDAREFDWYHHRHDSGHFHNVSSVRVVPTQTAPLPPPATPSPPHTQRSTFGIGDMLKRAFSSSKPHQQHQKEPASPVTDDGEDEPKTANHDGKFAPPWLTVARRSEKEQHERMIRTLNDSFESVGLIPPQDKKKTNKPRPHKSSKGEESVLDEVPEDSMCMLLPLWPEESDLAIQPRLQGVSRQSSNRSMSHAATQSLGYRKGVTASVPLEERKFLLVYYANQLSDNLELAADNGSGNNKKRRRPQTAGERPQHPSQSDIQGPFYAAGRLLTYENVRSSGVRLPGKGLSVNGTLADAAMAVPVPSSLASYSDGFEVIAVCQSVDSGVSLIHEGLVKLGLVDPRDEDENAKLSEVGRAVVEMVWCGCISLMLFTP